MEKPQVVHEGPYAGLYVPLNGQVAYVQGETRPYAPLFDTIIYDSVRGGVFYTSSPHTLVANPVYSVAPQSSQDEYAYFYKGNMPYCNGIVHEVKNGLTTEYTIITPMKPRRLFSQDPTTPQTDLKLQSSSTAPSRVNVPPKIPVYNKKTPVELDDAWLKTLNVNELLQEFGDH